MTSQLFYGECDDCRSFNYLHEIVTHFRDIRHVCTGCYEEYKYRFEAEPEQRISSRVTHACNAHSDNERERESETHTLCVCASLSGSKVGI